MFCCTAAMPRSSSRSQAGVIPNRANRFHVASSNLPAYHITFMWPM
jgi:hypothetical protein